MKIVVAPDSFKGTLSSFAVATSIAQELQEKYSTAEVVAIPLADGGEGTIACIRHAIGGKLVSNRTTAPYLGSKLMADILINGDTAVIESAKAIGLPLIGRNRNPLHTTTYGVGEMIKFGLDQGVNKFIIAIGGSSTNDGGIGMAVALGAKAYNKNGEEYIPTGGTLSKLEKIDVSGMDKRLADASFITLSDVTNPLCGKNGATYVFAPQKGAKEAILPILDAGLAKLAEVCENCMGTPSKVKDMSGAGAAGGLGYGTMAFLGAKIASGIDTIMKIVCFENTIKDADLIITGEGRFDEQSLMGKVVGGVVKVTTKHNKKVAVVAGRSTYKEPPEGIVAIVETNPNGISMSEVAGKAEEMLRTAVKDNLDAEMMFN